MEAKTKKKVENQIPVTSEDPDFILRTVSGCVYLVSYPVSYPTLFIRSSLAILAPVGIVSMSDPPDSCYF